MIYVRHEVPLPVRVLVMYLYLVFVSCCCCSCLVSATSNNGEKFRAFTLGEFTDHAGEGEYWWRGYRFTVKYPVAVTELRGGASAPPYSFDQVLFRLAQDGSEIEETLGSVVAGQSRRAVFKTPIELSPGKYYFIAQGRRDADGGEGFHFLVDNIDVTDLLSNFQFLSTWEPDNGKASFFIEDNEDGSQFVDMLGRNATSEKDSFKPDIGFGVSYHASAIIPSPSNVPTSNLSGRRSTLATRLPLQDCEQ